MSLLLAAIMIASGPLVLAALLMRIGVASCPCYQRDRCRRRELRRQLRAERRAQRRLGRTLPRAEIRGIE